MATPFRRISALFTGLALAGTAVLGASTAAPRTTHDLRPAFASTCIGYCQHPTNAAKVFRWGLEAWRQEFEVGSLSSHWRSNHPALVGQQQGMLTLKADTYTSNLTAYPDDQSAQYGRWEARVRAVDYEHNPQNPYRYYWELVPTSGNTSCGANKIILSTYVPGAPQAGGAIRTLPDVQVKFHKKLDLRSRAWHTYAVEVTPTHISWFVDTRVIYTERRPQALSGVTYRPQFEMVGDPQATMDRSAMQMDWVRYYDLHRPNAQPISAPQGKLGTFTPAGGTCS